MGHRDARLRDAIFVTVALWLFVILIYMPMLLDRHADEGWKDVFLDASTVLVSMALGMPLFAVFQATLRMPFHVKAVILGLALVGVAVAQTAFDNLFTGWVAQNISSAWAALPRDIRQSYGAAFNYLCVFGVNLALFQVAFSRRRSISQAKIVAEARSATQQAQLAALRFQLNPHFLFNTLNAISAMIVTRRNREAEEMTNKLSSFLRASLASDPTELVPLEQELAILEEYLEIEAIRFGDRLSIKVSCTPDAAEIPVPSLILQPLVENAIKYGVSPCSLSVCVQIKAHIESATLFVTVEDDGVPLEAEEKPVGTSVGLNNVRRRLETIYGPRGTLAAAPLADRGFAATIRLPTV